MSARFAASKTTAVTAAVVLFTGITVWIGATAGRQPATEASTPGAPQSDAPATQPPPAASRGRRAAPVAPRANPSTRTRAS